MPSSTKGVVSAPAWAVLTLLLAAAPSPTFGQEEASDASEPHWIEGWPVEIEGDDGKFTVYQPQLDSWDGYKLEAHTAISIQPEGEDAPAYGVAWFSARTTVDKQERLVELDDLEILRVSFPSRKEQEADYLTALRRDVAPNTRLIALDRLEAALATIEAEKTAADLPLKHDPPVIVFSSVPAILVYIDGQPTYRSIEGTNLQQVINTRTLLVRERSGKHFLHVFDGWMEAQAEGGPYQVSERPPRELAQAIEATNGKVDLLEGGAPEDPEREEGEESPKKPSLSEEPAPVIYIATRPTELIVTEGQPNYVPIDGTELLYAENTTGNLFQHTGENMTYVLVSGRWFRAPSSSGPWEFVPGPDLARDFAAIPDDSPKENVKASVPGTPQAQEAVIANSVPQSATVKRSEAKLTPPQFDGEPKLESIEGTSLSYVVNTPTPIVRTGPTSYYAVENGVWFVASSLGGPWVVATSVPASIYTIPPSSSLHYVTYVKVYHSTSEVVYVSYTPGYHSAYVSNGVVVYGTGYYYSPWIGSYWYGPPVTYGSGVCLTYTPWTGWSVGFGFGWSWGSVTVGWGWGTYPWWGPVGYGWYYPYPYYGPYYYPYRGGAAVGARGAAVWGPGGWAATSGNVYHRWGSTTAVTRRSGGYDALTGNRWTNRAGMSYNSRTGTLAAGQRAAIGNVYTGAYATGARGGVASTRTGATATGRVGTVGNVRTGQSVTGGGVTLRNPNTGKTTRVGAVEGNVYAGHDGNVYRRSSGGSWERNTGSGSWSSVQRPERSGQLNREFQSRSNGRARVNNFRSAQGRAGGRRRR